MKWIVVGGVFVLVGVMGWRVASVLSSDAIAMAIGMLLMGLFIVAVMMLQLVSDYRRTQAKPVVPVKDYWILPEEHKKLSG